MPNLLALTLTASFCPLVAAATGPATTPDAANAKVRIQVCAPAKRIYFNDLQIEQLDNHPQFTKYSRQQLDLAPKTIRRVAPSDDPRMINDLRAIKSYGIDFAEVLNRSGQYSYTSGFMPLEDSTVADQPVYEKGYGYPVKNYVAVSVRFFPEDTGLTAETPIYWFKLPEVIPAEGFSGWFPPTSMEPPSSEASDKVWYKLTNGGDLPIRPVSVNPPMMRVGLLGVRPTHNDPTNDSLPALTTARQRLKTATSGAQFVYEFVEKTKIAAPKCD